MPEIDEQGKNTLGHWASVWDQTREVTAARRHADLTRLRKYVLARWGRMRLDRITTAAVQQWVDQDEWPAVVDGRRMTLRPGAATKYASLMVLRQALDHALAAGALPANPASDVRVGEPTSVVRLQSADDVLPLGAGERLVEAMDPHYRTLALLGLRLGVTWAEAMGLQESDVDAKRSRITVGARLGVESEGRVTTQPSDQDPRVLSMPHDLAAALTAFMSDTADLRRGLEEPWLFVTPNGKRILRPNWNRYVLRPALRAAGLDERSATFHTLRHTAARDMLQKGVTLEDVARTLGHRTVNTTRRMYGAFVPGHGRVGG